MDESVKNVLIVEDEEAGREFVKEALSSERLRVTCAGDGAEGYRRCIEELPDLAILDVHMPKMDGFELFHRIRKDSRSSGIPVIMLTGVYEKSGIRFSKEDMRGFMGMEPEMYIEKPVDPTQLRRAVASLLDIEL